MEATEPAPGDPQGQLLAHIPEDGGSVGNTALMRALGWDGDRYWDVRDSLIDAGLIERGRGKGGSVRRISAPETEPTPDGEEEQQATEEVVELYRKEIELYEPMASVIATDWAKDRKDRPIAVVVTGLQGRRATGGKWTRPDLVSVNVKTWVHVPGRHLEVVTFEVKPDGVVDVSAVYEALAHLRSATHSYVLLHIPDTRLAEVAEVLEEVCQVARTHGIGVIVAGNPAEYSTWDERELPQRSEPDPARLNDFIETQLPEETREEIAKAVR